MSRSTGLAHIIRHDDGTSSGVWGIYTLQSAFQPIFAFNEGKLSVAAFEGLIRPFRDGEPQSPMSFFGTCPAGERLPIEGLTRTLHLLNAGACLPQEASIFINFDPSVFTDRAIVDKALRDMRLVLHEAGIDPRRIVCEVTEQRSASQETLYSFVEALRANGFRIAVDDYGADDSDINRVKELRPDIVKFDAHWITQLMESGAGFALLSAMVKSFESQGIRTVFEGIEEGWQLDLAEKSGASMVQGYVLARPELASTSFRGFGKSMQVPAADESKANFATSPAPVPPSRPAKAFGRKVTP
ncbi:MULTISPECIES: EAL domain-containing protein [unclassified Mesorhizobium]|uniref:EAL domain-containing protein n=1 Tax=unclassified Mesorhizobium TaxID=325217 RepID=UPI000F74FA4E|nr:MULTISPECIES: EAL domain-containing protein [unclassified Mesorhizobium]AZO22255.1 EAL domain-containing protein [Mesorhizobium sp. M1E.F.Ca.ET.045.02.1.1]RUW27715.1 EAL domain-containing protein [Mesorhizobium sp. M1E.F.Ca.ET.041.01.1.1]RUW82350.1 EAL domain-containing protein [Mesorhizobium sp. M1E.F.Ca.ET.063.01.1.1]RWD87418.1 MAG: EAL domain-containing protein [Mesorhizobium sp.]RWD93205.1 MAG: EAL domain-containing protein [Mesorhizobium sp.]